MRLTPRAPTLEGLKALWHCGTMALWHCGTVKIFGTVALWYCGPHAVSLYRFMGEVRGSERRQNGFDSDPNSVN